MKNLILFISVMVLSACGKGKEAPSKTKVTEDNNTKPIKVDDNATKPVKELTLRERVVGTYEMKDDNTSRGVFLDNGVFEVYVNGKKDEELHIMDSMGGTLVWRINSEGSIALFARIDREEKRSDAPKAKQHTLTKIK